MSNLNENDELYSDIAFQMFAAYVDESPSASAELMNSYSDYSNEPTFMPGVIFGCMLHMGILLSAIADGSNVDIKDAFKKYAFAYNTEIRQKLSLIPAMHQGEAKKIFELMRNFES